MESSQERITTFEKSLIIEGNGPIDVRKIVSEAEKRNWKRVHVTGDYDLTRAFWMEGVLQGMDVHGYKPTLADREQLKRRQEEQELSRTQALPFLMSGNAVANDYEKRVIPYVKSRLREDQNGLRKSWYSEDKERLQKFFRARQASHEQLLVQVQGDKAKFQEFGNKPVKVVRKMDQGISRYVLDSEVKKVLELTR